MCLQGLMKFHQWLFKIYSLYKSHQELHRKITPTVLVPSPKCFISSICLVHMNVFAKFDEIPSMTLEVIKETKRCGHTFGRSVGRSEGQRENSIP